MFFVKFEIQRRSLQTGKWEDWDTIEPEYQYGIRKVTKHFLWLIPYQGTERYLANADDAYRVARADAIMNAVRLSGIFVVRILEHSDAQHGDRVVATIWENGKFLDA